MIIGVILGMVMLIAFGCEAKHPRMTRADKSVERITFYPPNSPPETFETSMVYWSAPEYVSFQTTAGVGVEIHGVWKIEPIR